MSEKYIFCLNDFEYVIGQGLKDCFGYELVDMLKKQIIKELDYVNLARFYNRNCAGCVGGNTECNFAYQRDKSRETWAKVNKGELFNCPSRTNGSLAFDTRHPEKGVEEIDISDRKEKPYPVISEEEIKDVLSFYK